MRHELCRIAERLGLEGDIPKRGTNTAVEAAAALPHEGQSLLTRVDEFPVERGGIADDMKRRLGYVEPKLYWRGCLRLAKRLAKAE